MSTNSDDAARNKRIAELEALVDGKNEDDPNAALLAQPPMPDQRRYVSLYPGYSECFECQGDGCCVVCRGEGVYSNKRCSYCNGPGYCNTCQGAGQTPGSGAPA